MVSLVKADDRLMFSVSIKLDLNRRSNDPAASSLLVSWVGRGLTETSTAVRARARAPS